jgi:hypothetical protein
MNVNIDSDVRLIAGYAHNQIRALGANALERKDHIAITRQRAAVIFNNAPSDFMNLSGLALMESAFADEVIDFINIHHGDLSWRASASKKPPRKGQHNFIVSANGDDAGDEQFKWRTETVFVELEHRSFRKGAHRLAQSLHHLIDIERNFFHQSIIIQLADH